MLEKFLPSTYEMLLWFWVAFLAFLLFFLLIRWLVLWYWKINRIVVLLEDISYNTNALLESDVFKKSKDDALNK